MTYEQTLEYLYSRLPMFHRIGPAALKPDLSNTIAFCEALGHPENKFRSVHIAGTNGKGSVSHMLASILQEAGYSTGLYTSPHLVDFRERIRLNGDMIPREYVSAFAEKHQALIDKIEPSFFEVTVAMAFQFFAENKVDVAVIETGLGGRLDSTNVIKPLLSVITNISYDHQALLGNTLAEIAGEKAGIIKENTPAVMGRMHPETDEVFRQKAAAMHAPLYFPEKIWHNESSEFEHDTIKISYSSGGRTINIQSPLAGSYQAENIRTVLQSVALLNEAGLHISEEQMLAGIAKVKTNTHLRGRWEVLQSRPLVVADVAHNEAGLREVFGRIAGIPHRRLHIVYGMVKDKDIAKALAMLPKDALYYFSAPKLPRALEVAELLEHAAAAGLQGSGFSDIYEAFTHSLKNAGPEDVVLVAGSIFVVAEVLEHFPEE